MLVLDDGWFGKRRDDNRALGDWQVNEEKLKCSLGELSAKIHAMGLKFGLWVEPEMVSEDSDLYRAHPDWALQIPGKIRCEAGISWFWTFPEKMRWTLFLIRLQKCWIMQRLNI